MYNAIPLSEKKRLNKTLFKLNKKMSKKNSRVFAVCIAKRKKFRYKIDGTDLLAQQEFFQLKNLIKKLHSPKVLIKKNYNQQNLVTNKLWCSKKKKRCWYYISTARAGRNKCVHVLTVRKVSKSHHH